MGQYITVYSSAKGHLGYFQFGACYWIVSPKWTWWGSNPQELRMWPSRGVADITVKMRSYQSKVGHWSNMIRILRKIEKPLCEDKDRDQGDTATSQGTPMVVRKPPEARRGLTDSPSESSEVIKPADTLISDFYSPKLWEHNYLLFKPSSFWYFVMTAQENEYRTINNKAAVTICV